MDKTTTIETGPKIETEYQELVTLLNVIESRPENIRINPKDFRGAKHEVNGEWVYTFPEAMVKGDLKDVEKKREMISKEETTLSEKDKQISKMANFIEVAVPEAIRKFGWLGENVKVIRPSLYDDYFRGIDNIVQVEPNKPIENEKDINCIGFSIDFTISEKAAVDKMFWLAVSLAKGKIPSVKYFSANIKTKEGTSKNVKIKDFQMPKVIMACPGRVNSESKGDLLNVEKNPNDQEAIAAAKDTTLRYYFIRETLTQLAFLSDTSKRLGNMDAAELYAKSLESFQQIMAEQGITQELLDQKLDGIKSLTQQVNYDDQFLGFIKSTSEINP